ncbi:NERD domain-containing protein [Bacillus sp. ISL-41]|uniref:NERD domain-containing protein n=1 Tax=Bacillus sp. ISL-41 TaxID=2819127 RepID=UPI001BE7D095|nr:NERD domain-containing protein [Bacillus sp. ISL-41]
MIAKYRSISLEILIYDAVYRRLPDHHPRKSEFRSKLGRWKAAHKGETEVDYYLSLFPDDDLTIFQYLRLPHKNGHFQIDTLIISPSFIAIIESKNYAGTIVIDLELDQLLQTYDGIEKGYNNPILQAEIQSLHLKKWFINHQLPLAPIEIFATISNPQTIIKNPAFDKEAAYRICRAARIPFRISTLKSQYQKEKLTMKEIKKITRLLLKEHVPYVPDTNSLDLPQDLITGVQCPHCNHFGMERIHGAWFCRHCGHTSTDAHIAAVKDYFLLNGFILTNRRLREFLHINSGDTITRILQSLNFPFTGGTKNRIYTPPEDFFK